MERRGGVLLWAVGLSLYSCLCFLGPNISWPGTDRDVLPRVIVFNSLSFVWRDWHRVIWWQPALTSQIPRPWYGFVWFGPDWQLCLFLYFVTLPQSVCNVAGLLPTPNSQLPTLVLVIQCNVDFSNNDLKTVWPGEMSDVGYRFIIGLLYFYYCHFLTFQPGQVCILNWQCLFWLRMVLLEYSLSLSLSPLKYLAEKGRKGSW